MFVSILIVLTFIFLCFFLCSLEFLKYLFAMISPKISNKILCGRSREHYCNYIITFTILSIYKDVNEKCIIYYCTLYVMSDKKKTYNSYK